jgi:hypothetical protein
MLQICKGGEYFSIVELGSLTYIRFFLINIKILFSIASSQDGVCR